MEPSRSEPVCIVKSVGEFFSAQCSLEDHTGEWQGLKQFWGEERHRLQDVDGLAKPISSSLEDHLMYDECLDKPTASKDTCDLDLEPRSIANGKDINDIPTSYALEGFKPRELIVIGTYVDKNIVPGFKYKVRKNLSEKYLFDGKALHLKSVGLGYGKRLTFDSPNLNNNENFFWSDSRVHGYGFSLQAVSPGDVFTILDRTTGNDIGRIVINRLVGEQIENSNLVQLNGRVEKEIQVQFSCDIILNDCSNKQNFFVPSSLVSGKAVVVRDTFSSKAIVKKMMLDDFFVKDCELMPDA